MKKIYSNLVQEITKCGHEVGLHGMWHEYLTSDTVHEQTNKLGYMIADMGCPISGANFIGRYNVDTIEAAIKKRLTYLLYPSIIHYKFSSYSKNSTIPSFLGNDDGSLFLIPVNVETYSSPWFSIKNKIDTAIVQARKEKTRHISILCHPFRDGNLAHINNLRNILSYLRNRGLKSVTLEQYVKQILETKTSLPISSRLFSPKLKAFSQIARPMNKTDIGGFLPENLITAYIFANRKRSVF